ncbi:MAG TPA: prepilin peptidase [Pyrinomonadaceae bacterium]|jgi:prepilin peptidase CpaA
MPSAQNFAIFLLLVPMAIVITYMDVRYRRIPNKLVLVMLLGGIAVNSFFGGTQGLLVSLEGFGLAFALMFFFHIFGTLGAGDVKLFAAIGAVNGIALVLPMLLVVAITGALLAIGKMVHAGRARTTMFGVLQFFYGLLPGQKVPRFDIPSDRSYTLPYAVPICFGSLLAFMLFHS